MSSTYAFYETPIFTNHGMIIGITTDGNYKFAPSPVINMNGFYRSNNNNVGEKKYGIGEYYNNINAKRY